MSWKFKEDNVSEIGIDLAEGESFSPPSNPRISNPCIGSSMDPAGDMEDRAREEPPSSPPEYLGICTGTHEDSIRVAISGGGSSELTVEMNHPSRRISTGDSVYINSEGMATLCPSSPPDNYHSLRRYHLTCSGCGESLTIITGPFELRGNGVVCCRCGYDVRVSQVDS